MKVMFVCTGNYFRSKFCECYLNAISKSKDTTYYSCGIDVTYPGNIGEVSVHTKSYLMELGIDFSTSTKDDISVYDLDEFDTIYVMNLEEHYHFMNSRYPQFMSKCIFLDFKDIFDEKPRVILDNIYSWILYEFKGIQ